MTETIAFIVRVPRPKETRIADVKSHIQDAVKSWGGRLDPMNELFDLCDTATVTRSKEHDK